jgi:hypothetical protein
MKKNHQILTYLTRPSVINELVLKVNRADNLSLRLTHDPYDQSSYGDPFDP